MYPFNLLVCKGADAVAMIAAMAYSMVWPPLSNPGECWDLSAWSETTSECRPLCFQLDPVDIALGARHAMCPSMNKQQTAHTLKNDDVQSARSNMRQQQTLVAHGTQMAWVHASVACIESLELERTDHAQQLIGSRW
jgi:hypothetical protein